MRITLRPMGKAGAPSTISELELLQFAVLVPLEHGKLKFFQITFFVVFDLANGGIEGVAMHVVGHCVGVFANGLNAGNQNLNSGVGGHGECAIGAATVGFEVFQNLLVAWQLGEVGW